MPSRRQILAGMASATLAGCTAPTAPNPGTNDTTTWTHPNGGPAASGFVSNAVAPRTTVSERWAVDISTPSDRPVADTERVYAPVGNRLKALDIRTGETVWDTPSGSHQFTPIVHDGIVFHRALDGIGVTARDAADGSLLWEVETPGPTTALTLSHEGGQLYVGDRTGRIAVIDREREAVVDTAEVFGEVTRLAAFGMLYAGTGAGLVYSGYWYGDDEGLQWLWKRRLDGQVTALTAGNGSVVFAGGFSGDLRCLEGGAHAGTVQWRTDDVSPNEGFAVTARAVVTTDLSQLSAYHARTGDRQWHIEGTFNGAPAAAGDTVYVGGEESVQAYALGSRLPFAGRKRWEHPIPGVVKNGLAIADGAVFALATGGEEGSPTALALE